MQRILSYFFLIKYFFKKKKKIIYSVFKIPYIIKVSPEMTVSTKDSVNSHTNPSGTLPLLLFSLKLSSKS